MYNPFLEALAISYKQSASGEDTRKFAIFHFTTT
jgi:hypothetical protein